MHPILWLLTFIGGNIGVGTIYHEVEKAVVSEEAYKYARRRGKPVLDFGCGSRPRGHYNVDVTPRKAPNFLLIQRFEKPRLPFPDKFFASALCFHVLEHTSEPEHALKELRRVSERVYVITPKPIWLMTWLQSDHQWIFITNHVYFKNPLYHSVKDLEDIPILYP